MLAHTSTPMPSTAKPICAIAHPDANGEASNSVKVSRSNPMPTVITPYGSIPVASAVKTVRPSASCDRRMLHWSVAPAAPA